jgi:hypothetical protein
LTKRSAWIGLFAIVWLSERPASADAPARAFWLGAVIEQDGAFVSGQDVCSQQSQLDDGFTCLRASGSQYHGTPRYGLSDNINQGFLLATTRVKALADYAVVPELTLGVRVGYVLRGGGPTPDGGHAFRPFHLEARVSYWPLERAYAPSALSPYLFAAGGLAEVDSHIGVTVVEDTSVPPPPNQPDNPPEQHLEAHRKMGGGFVAAGAGAFYPLAPNHGPLVEIALLRLFPSAGTAAQISIGYAFGF